ncbi:MAG: Coenzyme F420 hydrogenase/dehydrogenase, beta subunit C-terminal domain [Desulfobacteraceae bacterium]
MNSYHAIGRNSYLDAARSFFKSLLETGEVQSLLVPLRQDRTNDIMPTLVTDPEDTDKADPFSPSFPLNSAKLVSRLTRKKNRKRVAVFLRPCEIRAVVELVKLKQADMENLVIISSDCFSAFPNSVFNTGFREKGEEFTNEYISARMSASFTDDYNGSISEACRICTDPFPGIADIVINPDHSDAKQVTVESKSDAGGHILAQMGLDEAEPPKDGKEKRKKVMEELGRNREETFQSIQEQTADLEKLGVFFSSCVNCYNCRVACPVCYCRECVFNTDVFDHEPLQYINRSQTRGSLRMPSDTMFFHLTRMIHIGLSCVGCGQCANACPNDIPLSGLFMSVADKAQKGFDYTSGGSIEENHPLSCFFEDELNDVTGI